MALLITPNGDVTKIEPENGKNFRLEELYNHIGCTLINVCDTDKDGEILIFDEEFLCKNDPEMNRLATGRMHPDLMPGIYNVICGNAVLCNTKQFN